MKEVMKRFWSDEQGLETVEYAIIAALITLAVVATVTLVGQSVNAKFEQLNSKLQ